MPLLHDPAVRMGLCTRIEALRPDAQRCWGTMEIDQMLWHLNSSLVLALGEISCEPQDNLITRTLLKRVVLYGPWPKGRVPTLREITATARYNVEAERQRLLELIESFTARDLTARWPRHPKFGALSGSEQSHLNARHVDYHLQQFGG